MNSEQQPKVLVFAASTRTGTYNRKLAIWTANELRNAGMEVTLPDLRDYSMPLYDGDSEASQGVPENAQRLKEVLRQHEALVIASPEYNGSFSALLKNTIDWISRPAPGRAALSCLSRQNCRDLECVSGQGAGKRGLRPGNCWR